MLNKIIEGLAMSGHLGNKEIMAENLQRYMNMYGLDRNDIAEIAGVSYFTVTAWLKARTYPRIDKIEILANHWNISKADLVEPESERPKPPTPIVEEIGMVSSKLEEPRQKVVLETANAQFKEQEEEKAKIISLKNEQKQTIDLADLVDDNKVDWDKWVSFDGKPLTDEVKEAMKQALGKRLEDK